MSHLDDESLAALAMGDGEVAASEHTDACDACRAELEALRATLGLLERTAPEPLLTPPDRVWQSIVAELDSDEPHEARPASDIPTPAPADDLAAKRAERVARAPRWLVGAAAAAGVVVGGLGVGLAMNASTSDPGLEVVAQTELTDLASDTPAGEAILETRADGTQVLVVDTEFTDVDDAYLEVWLIDESIDGMVSLGHLTGDHTEFLIPAGFDVSAFPIVDISVEPLDGVPTHSGDSVTRGVLNA